MVLSLRYIFALADFVAHGSNVNCLALSPSNGHMLATGGDDRKVNLWLVGKPNNIMVSFFCKLVCFESMIENMMKFIGIYILQFGTSMQSIEVDMAFPSPFAEERACLGKSLKCIMPGFPEGGHFGGDSLVTPSKQFVDIQVYT